MRMSFLLPVAAALAAVATGSSGDVYAKSRGPAPVVRDHRPAPTVRDHRTPPPVIRNHRTPTPVVRDHRTPPKGISVRPAGKKVIRADRNYDKTPNREQVIVNGKRVPRKVDGGPVIRDHRTPPPVVRDHRRPTMTVRDHRASAR
jgi:hypothetical protein